MNSMLHGFPPFFAKVLINSLLVVLLCSSQSCAQKRVEIQPADYLRNLACRIVAMTGESKQTIQPLLDANLDTLSSDAAMQTFAAVIHDNRKLGARVKHVNVRLPRDRFNVTMMLDGNVFFRTNHMDLDIYVETTIDDRVYALHCFPELAQSGE